ncbi:cilia- and flagella-associated protein 157 [Culicoides brevitarsis]|uniref:cilia- and flagella-associated protein 157 n=1 Tax=Culicoides brevitarsis TaxID=469753 RepID=UPI00307B5671
MGKELPKKPKKGRKKDGEGDDGADQMSAVDRQFYELSIADLNNKLSRLRAHTTKLEEKNEELESKMRQMEEDKSDTTAYLNRTLNEKLNTISELEDKLSELSKVRDAENIEFKKVLSEREAKYKAMHDQLTSEIKLLTGKLNSMEEFRIQRDELLAKFDAQETELKEQHKRHKAILYEMERKVILDKDLLRKDVENKLLQLSTEFTKSSEIRVAAHTQRLVRENIALNNEMDRMIYTHERLRREYDEMKHANLRIKSQAEIIESEKARLVRTCQGHIRIIEELTSAYEKLRERSMTLKNIHKQFEAAKEKLKDSEEGQKSLQHKTKMLEQHVHAINCQRMALCADIMMKQQQMDHIFKVLKTVKMTIKSAIKAEEAQKEEDIEFRMAQRKTLLDDLLNILTELDAMPMQNISTDTIPSANYVYLQGDLGILPKESLEQILASVRHLPPMQQQSIEALGVIPTATGDVSLAQMSEVSEKMFDVVSGSLLKFDDSDAIPVIEEPEDEETEILTSRKKSIQKTAHIDEEITPEGSLKDVGESASQLSQVAEEEDLEQVITDAGDTQQQTEQDDIDLTNTETTE